MNYIYLIGLSCGSFDDYVYINLFAVTNEDYAIAYINKANRILNKWKEYYKRFEYFDGSFNLASHEKYFDRWLKLDNYNKLSYQKIPIRN